MILGISLLTGEYVGNVVKGSEEDDRPIYGCDSYGSFIIKSILDESLNRRKIQEDIWYLNKLEWMNDPSNYRIHYAPRDSSKGR